MIDKYYKAVEITKNNIGPGDCVVFKADYLLLKGLADCPKGHVSKISYKQIDFGMYEMEAMVIKWANGSAQATTNFGNYLVLAKKDKMSESDDNPNQAFRRHKEGVKEEVEYANIKGGSSSL